MAPAGHSGTPLVRKLGLREGDAVGVVDRPAELGELLGPLPEGVELGPVGPDGLDVVLLFATRRAVLEHELPGAARSVFPHGAVWVAWPKKASRVPTDITEDVVREVVLPIGLVDNKVCAISDVWSGLRVVWRKERRSGPEP